MCKKVPSPAKKSGVVWTLHWASCSAWPVEGSCHSAQLSPALPSKLRSVENRRGGPDAPQLPSSKQSFQLGNLVSQPRSQTSPQPPASPAGDGLEGTEARAQQAARVAALQGPHFHLSVQRRPAVLRPLLHGNTAASCVLGGLGSWARLQHSSFLSQRLRGPGRKLVKHKMAFPSET